MRLHELRLSLPPTFSVITNKEQKSTAHNRKPRAIEQQKLRNGIFLDAHLRPHPESLVRCHVHAVAVAIHFTPLAL